MAIDGVNNIKRIYKNWLGKMPVVNKAFEAVGPVLSSVTHGVSAAASGL